MKKCPFCNAEIQENARFCLYCMTSLEEKTVILPTRRKKWLWWLMVIPVLLLLGGVLWRVLATPEQNAAPTLQQPEDAVSQTTQGTQETTEGTEPKAGDGTQLYVPPAGQTPPQGDNTTDTKPTPNPQQPATDATQPSTEPTQPVTTPTPPATDVTTPPTQATEPTQPTTEPTQTEPYFPPLDYGNGIPGTTGYQTQFSIAHWSFADEEGIPFNPPGTDVFWYRSATAEHMEAAGYSAEEKGWIVDEPGSHIRCGIYEISETVRGYPVVGIDIEYFWLNDIVKITIPKTISSLPSEVFYYCEEFKYLCIKGDQMTIPKDAFPPMEKRWYTIVIRCSADCKDENGRYWKNIAGEYGAVWEEWNG